jgi:hypothetical protein
MNIPLLWVMWQRIICLSVRCFRCKGVCGPLALSGICPTLARVKNYVAVNVEMGSFISNHSQTVISILLLFLHQWFFKGCFSGPNKWQSDGQVKDSRVDCLDVQREMTATNLASGVLVWVCLSCRTIRPRDMSRLLRAFTLIFVPRGTNPKWTAPSASHIKNAGTF